MRQHTMHAAASGQPRAGGNGWLGPALVRGGLAAVRRAPARRRDCPAGCGAAAGVGSGRILGLGGWPGRRGGARSGHPAWRPGGGALRGDRAPWGPVPAFGSGLSGGLAWGLGLAWSSSWGGAVVAVHRGCRADIPSHRRVAIALENEDQCSHGSMVSIHIYVQKGINTQPRTNKTQGKTK